MERMGRLAALLKLVVVSKSKIEGRSTEGCISSVVFAVAWKVPDV